MTNVSTSAFDSNILGSYFPSKEFKYLSLLLLHFKISHLVLPWEELFGWELMVCSEGLRLSMRKSYFSKCNLKRAAMLLIIKMYRKETKRLLGRKTECFQIQKISFSCVFM